MPFYKQSYKRIRFHVEFGPPSLFERVRFKIKDETTLYMDGVHFQTRASERNIPDDIMARLFQFDINEWRVVTASVREDRGKFIDSTWEIVIDGVRYWVTIGMGTFIKTIVVKETSGVEKNCIPSGEYCCLEFLVQNNLVYESDWTSYGNPREYSLCPSLQEFLFNCPAEIAEKLQKIKDA